MVYKSKKKNRRRYLKGLPKKQSRKKMYGGYPYNTLNNTLNNNNANTFNNNDVNNNTNNSNPPSLSSNLEKIQDIILHLANIFTATGIKTIESKIESFIETLGIDTNADVKDELKRILTKIVELRAALETEEGKAALAELEAILTKVSVEVVGPGVNKIADSVIEHSGQMAKNSTKAALAAFSATPLGIVLDIPTLVKNIASLAKNFTTLANELTTIIINMLGKSKESRNKFTEAFAKITNVIEKGNESLSNTLNTVQNNVKNLTNQNLTNNDYANNFANQNANNNANNNEKNNEKNFANQKGGLLNTYRQQAKMVGGRILQSKLEFLSSNVTKHKKTHKHINK